MIANLREHLANGGLIGEVQHPAFRIVTGIRNFFDNRLKRCFININQGDSRAFITEQVCSSPAHT